VATHRASFLETVAAGGLANGNVWTEDGSFLDDLSANKYAILVTALLSTSRLILQSGESWRMKLAAVALLVHFGLWAVTKISGLLGTFNEGRRCLYG